MSSYKIFHLKGEGLEHPLAMKINLKHHYVRIAAPFYEIIHLRHQLFNASQVIVSNAYGAPLFNLLAPQKTKDQWIIQEAGEASLKVSFSHTGHTHAMLEDEHYGTIHFNFMENEEPTLKEKEMIVAALAACHFHGQFTTDRQVAFA
jgi:hypothetical protein